MVKLKRVAVVFQSFGPHFGTNEYFFMDTVTACNDLAAQNDCHKYACVFVFCMLPHLQRSAVSIENLPGIRKEGRADAAKQ